MIMGNAFAAITVMTVDIGAPFVLAYGADPAAIGILALTCGYCGTLCTPMATLTPETGDVKAATAARCARRWRPTSTSCPLRCST